MIVYLILAIALLIVGHIFKNLRWKQIIQTYEEVDKYKLLEILAIGQGTNMVLPYRIGDIIRIVLLGHKRLKNGYVLAFASVVADLFIDTLTVGLAYLTLYLFDIHKVEIADMAFRYGALSGIAMILCVLVISRKKDVKQIIYKVSTAFNETIEQNLLLTTYTFFSSIKKLYEKKNMIKLITFTIGTWSSYFVSYGAFAIFLQHLGYDFTLTKVFKTIFSMNGSSLLLESVKNGNSELEWSIWFTVYLIVPILIILTFSIIKNRFSGRQEYKHSNILPQLKPSERLAFLSIYFSSEEKDYFNSYLEINKNVNVLQDCSAGSNATTILCIKNDNIFYRKYSFGEDADKLWKQVEWLEKYESQLPLTKITSKTKRNDYCFYDMKYSEDARGYFSFIHSSSPESNREILFSVLKTLEETLYCHNRKKCDENELRNYIDSKVIKNINICEEWSKNNFKDIWKSEKININGLWYPNLRHYSKMLSKENLFAVFSEDEYSDIHGDLTVENIICCNRNSDKPWYLIDPNNGNMHETPFLDYAKLLQSLHGHYEFLMLVENAEVKKNHIEFLCSDSIAYRRLYNDFNEYLFKHYSKKEIKSIYYHEIIHWLRLMPYKIKKNSEKAIIFYSGMLRVLHDVEEMFNDEN